MNFQEFFQKIKDFLNIVIVNIDNGHDLTVFTLLALVVGLSLLIFIAKHSSKFLEEKVLIKRIPEKGTRVALVTIFKYTFLCIGFVFILNIIGFNLSSLGWLLGALGVGIGFGLQNITNNFISGIIILFERPVKVGDRIEVAHIKGDVIEISIRSTTIVTNDNISVIVPNSELINSNVINWSHNDKKVRFRFPIGISYNEDPEKIKKIVLEIAKENEGVLKHPAPDFWFVEYGDNSLNFELVVWTSKYVQRPVVLKSQLYYKIFAEFTRHNVEIPFPQRDLHLRGGFEDLIKKFGPEAESDKNKETTEN